MNDNDKNSTTILIVPGLRDHVPEHWQTLLAEQLPKVRSVPPLEQDKLSLPARVEAIQRELEQIDGPVGVFTLGKGFVPLSDVVGKAFVLP